MQFRFSENEFLALGLTHCGWSEKSISRNGNKNKDIRFRDRYYVTPKTWATIFNDIQDIGEASIKKPNPRYLLLALYYLKKYPTKHEMASFLDGNEGTALNQSKKYIKAIQALKVQKIKWIFGDDTGVNGSNLDEVFIISVDGIHCRIYEPRIEPSTKWFSHKFHGPGLVYELGIAIFHNQIVSIKGPFPASRNDWTIFSITTTLEYTE